MKGAVMGATNFIEFGCGKTAEEAFDKLVAEFTEYYGVDPYNGTIATTELDLSRPVVVVQKRYTGNARKKAEKVAKQNDWGEKWLSRAIDCGACGGGYHVWAFYGLAAC